MKVSILPERLVYPCKNYRTPALHSHRLSMTANILVSRTKSYQRLPWAIQGEGSLGIRGQLTRDDFLASL